MTEQDLIIYTHWLQQKDAEIERLTAEREALLTDAERLDFLDSLLHRVEYQNQKRPTESVGTDLHIHSGKAALYIRNLFGNVVTQGHGDSVRAAIDAAREKV